MKDRLLKMVLRMAINKLAKNPPLLKWVGKEIVSQMPVSDAVSVALKIRDLVRGKKEA